MRMCWILRTEKIYDVKKKVLWCTQSHERTDQENLCLGDMCVCLGVEGERYEIIIFSGLTGAYINNVFIYILSVLHSSKFTLWPSFSILLCPLPHALGNALFSLPWLPPLCLFFLTIETLARSLSFITGHDNFISIPYLKWFIVVLLSKEEHSRNKEKMDKTFYSLFL